MNFEHKKLILGLFVNYIERTIPNIYRHAVSILEKETPCYEEILEFLYNEFLEIIEDDKRLELFKTPYTIAFTREYKEECKTRLDKSHKEAVAYRSKAGVDYIAMLNANKIYKKLKTYLKQELQEVEEMYESLIKNGVEGPGLSERFHINNINK